MAEIVNLRRVRKERARERDEAQAAEHRVLFGRTKSERRLADVERAKSDRDLDARRLDPPPDGE